MIFADKQTNVLNTLWDVSLNRELSLQEASLLISNLEKQDIEKNQIILDPLDIKALANLQESLVQ